MKVLLVHNYYRTAAPSGENAVFEAERDLLAARGVEVDAYVVHNDDLEPDHRPGAVRPGALRLGQLRGALATPWNPVHRRRLRVRLRQAAAAGVPPDVMHVHNTFPRLSPAVFGAAAGTGTAVVYTLHNFRMLCANALFLRDGQTCTLCRDRRTVWPALRYACYRDSRPATLPLAAMIALHRRLRTLERHVDAFIALTEFQKAQFVAAGWPAERIHVKPNFHPAPPRPVPWAERGGEVVYLGRLAPEKGLDVLLDAWAAWGAAAPPLTLYGNGPERARLEARLAGHPAADRIRLAEALPFAEAQARLARARLLVLPSVCFEGFPMAVGEAMALGVPVAASALGSLPELVDDGASGRLLPPGDAAGWAAGLAALWAEPERLAAMGAAGRARFERDFTAEASFTRLMEIYGVAMERRRNCS